MFALLVGTRLNGEHAFATSGGTAWRRRQRRLRAFRRFVLWHSKMEVAAALHHSSGLRTSGPMYDQVHQEQFAAGEMSENLVGIPVAQEQVIVQAFPVVVGSLSPAEQFTGPVYYQAHHEQFAAGETTEKSAEFPVVQEQVIVQAIPRVAGFTSSC